MKNEIDLIVEARRLYRQVGLKDTAIARKLKQTRHWVRKHVGSGVLEDAFPDIEPQTAAEYVERIKSCWRKSVEAIFEVGRILTAAKGRLEHGEFTSMVENGLPFSLNTADRLMKVAADSRLSNSAHVHSLPASWGTLYELTKLDDSALESGFTKGMIRPEMERKEVVALRLGGPINGARSVMGSRVEPDDSLDFFPTPPFSTRALCEIVLPHIMGGDGHYFKWIGSVWEPACGEGHMSEVLKEYFGGVVATDCFDYGSQDGVEDFLKYEGVCSHDFIITNPPFGDRTIPFILRAIELARVGVAMFLRLQILETIERYEQIFKPHPPTMISFFSERVNLCKGRWDPDGGTATAYVWLVWMKDRAPMAPFWIPPGQREALTKEDDRARFAAWSMPNNAEAAE